MAPTKYTMEEIQKHNKPDDLWFVVHDKVYDATKFLNEHPGGSEVLEERAGKNATKEFDDADHSSDAIEQMAEYYIGDLDDGKSTSQSNNIKDDKAKPKYCLFGVSALAIAVGAFIIYKGFKLAKGSSN